MLLQLTETFCHNPPPTEDGSRKNSATRPTPPPRGPPPPPNRFGQNSVCPVGSPAYRRWGTDRSVPQKIAVRGPTCRLPRHCLDLYLELSETILPLPHPANLVRLRRSRKMSATTPPPSPPNLVGLWTSRKIYRVAPPPIEHRCLHSTF